MTAVLAVTGPIFALIGLGYVITRIGLFDAGDLRALGRYVVMLALPALIFRAVTARDLAEVIDPAYLAAYLGGSLLSLAAGYGLSRRAGLDGAASTFQAMGVSCANSGFMGYPIMLIAMPAVADSALALNMIVENLVIIPLVLVLAEARSQRRHRPVRAAPAGRDESDRAGARRRADRGPDPARGAGRRSVRRSSSSRGRAPRCRWW